VMWARERGRVCSVPNVLLNHAKHSFNYVEINMHFVSVCIEYSYVPTFMDAHATACAMNGSAGLVPVHH